MSDNAALIVQAKNWVKLHKKPPADIPAIGDSVRLVRKLVAALGAVQPVTPDRETLAKALWEIENVVLMRLNDGIYQWSNIRIGSGTWTTYTKRADALLASGVLGQPQPQPDRDQIKAAVKSGATDGYWKRTGYRVTWEHLGPLTDAITDALLPLLGQPRTDDEPSTALEDAFFHGLTDALDGLAIRKEEDR